VSSDISVTSVVYGVRALLKAKGSTDVNNRCDRKAGIA
jgi:hypothetical protein